MLIVRAIKITRIIAVRETIIIILDIAIFKEDDGRDFFTLKIYNICKIHDYETPDTTGE